MSNFQLYFVWFFLYILCGGLSFLPNPGTLMQILMTFLSLILFVPPLLLNRRAAAEGDRRTLKLIAYLCLIWLIFACVLLVMNLLSVLLSELAGNILHYLLCVIASPLICCGSWALAIFCWAFVLFDAISKLKK